MSEHDEQATVIAWAGLFAGQHPELDMLFAVPNGARLSKGGYGWKKLEREGAKKGVPDLFLPCPRKGYAGLFVEMKHKTNKPTPEQAWWLDRLTEQGYLAVACWESQEAIEVIAEYLEIEQ